MTFDFQTLRLIKNENNTCNRHHRRKMCSPVERRLQYQNHIQ